MRADDSASPPNEKHNIFRIADLADQSPCSGPTAFRFMNRQTMAIAGLQHSAFVDAAKSFLRGEDAAFRAHEIRFAGVPPTKRQLTAFARTLTDDLATTTRPIVGRYWTGLEIEEVGTFSGLSFWLSFRDLTRVSWAPAASIEILGLRSPVYVESIDQCAPEIFSVNPADRTLHSAIDPRLTPADILALLIRALAPDPKLSRKQWEIVSECRWPHAYDLARVAAESRDQTIETSWRWQPDFNRTVVRNRAAWVRRA